MCFFKKRNPPILGSYNIAHWSEWGNTLEEAQQTLDIVSYKLVGKSVD